MKTFLLHLLLIAAFSQPAFAGGRDRTGFSFRSPDAAALSLRMQRKANIWAPLPGSIPAPEVQSTRDSRRLTASTGLIIAGILLTGVGAALLISGNRESEANKPDIGLKGLGKELGGVLIGGGGLAMVIGGLVSRYRVLHPAVAPD